MTVNTWDRATRATDAVLGTIQGGESGRVLAGVNPNGNDANRTNAEHGSSRAGGGHGGGKGHGLSREGVRRARRSGQQFRGRHENGAHRNERGERLFARAIKATVDRSAIVDALIREYNFAPSIREDAAQELWLALLEGASERELRAMVPGIRSRLMRVEYGEFGDVSLDAPTRTALVEGGTSTFADLVDESGRIAGGQAPLPVELAVTLEWKAAERLAIREARVAAEAVRRAERLAIREARKLELLARMACACGASKSPGAARCAACREKAGRYTPPEVIARVHELAGRGASLRTIAAWTGLARNTVSTIIGPRSEWGTITTPMSDTCERCGMAGSSHSPSSRARRARIVRVCERAVRRCACGGWRSVASVNMCRDCRDRIAVQRRQLVAERRLAA